MLTKQVKLGLVILVVVVISVLAIVFKAEWLPLLKKAPEVDNSTTEQSTTVKSESKKAPTSSVTKTSTRVIEAKPEVKKEVRRVVGKVLETGADQLKVQVSSPVDFLGGKAVVTVKITPETDLKQVVVKVNPDPKAKRKVDFKWDEIDLSIITVGDRLTIGTDQDISAKKQFAASYIHRMK